MSTQETTRGAQVSGPPDLIVIQRPDSAAAQSYRAVRASLRHARGEVPIHSVLLADVGSKDQTGEAAANIAASFALNGDRTVLIDADTANPVQHRLLDVPQHPGLVDWLVDDGGSGQPEPFATGIPELYVLPSGEVSASDQRSPADLLTSEACARLTERLGNDARFVLFHSTAAPASSESLTIAAHVDAVLLLVRSGVTKRTDAQRAKEALERVGARMLGVVLTDT